VLDRDALSLRVNAEAGGPRGQRAVEASAPVQNSPVRVTFAFPLGPFLTQFLLVDGSPLLGANSICGIAWVRTEPI
jgi:hypothetical protein